MATEKSLAIVIRIIEFSETSVIATLFTDRFGKISALAKGARRPKGPFEAALDLLALCRIVFIHKSTDALDLLTEAKLERRFRSASRDLTRLYAGYYVAELLNELTDPADPHPAVFEAVNQILADLDGESGVASTVLRFELTLLRELGLLPSLQTCVECGQPLDSRKRVAFGMLAGGVLCERCRTGHRQVVSASGEVVEILRRFSEVGKGNGWEAEYDRRHHGELRGLVNHYISHVLGHRPKMQKFMGMLEG